MSKILKNELSQIDIEKSSYDLALIYSKAKLDEAIQNNKFNGNSAPVEIEQMEYLAEEFYGAFGYFTNMTDEGIKYLIDRT
jgi:hypothetical protein